MNHPPATLFDQFLKERLYLKNVTPRTLVWYRVAFNSYRAMLGPDAPPLPTRASLRQFLIRLRDRGIRPVTCNTYVAAMNAFCAWLHEERHVAERVKLKKLKVERRVLELLNETQMRALISVKPKTFITTQNQAQFSGTFQSSGGTAVTCAQSGGLNGTVATDGAISMTFTATLGLSTACTRISGTGIFAGVLSGTSINVQTADRQRCTVGSVTADGDRSVSISMRKQ